MHRTCHVRRCGCGGPRRECIGHASSVDADRAKSMRLLCPPHTPLSSSGSLFLRGQNVDCYTDTLQTCGTTVDERSVKSGEKHERIVPRNPEIHCGFTDPVYRQIIEVCEKLERSSRKLVDKRNRFKIVRDRFKIVQNPRT